MHLQIMGAGEDSSGSCRGYGQGSGQGQGHGSGPETAARLHLE